MKIAIIGSGPAGLAAAVSASDYGAEVIVFERMPELSVKLRASGGGRCNFSNIMAPVPFMEKFGKNGRFMQDALLEFPKEYLFDFLKNSQVPFSAEDGFHYFPDSGKARDIAEAFQKTARKKNTRFLTECTVENIHPGFKLELNSGETFHFDKVILACGGKAFPSLGGTDRGLDLAKRLGHTVIQPVPALTPVFIKESWVGSLAGISLKNAYLEMGKGRKKSSCSGNLLFTHKGFSGPCALNISGSISEALLENRELPVLFQPLSGCDAAFWQKQFQGMPSEGKTVRNWLGKFLPKALADRYCELTGTGDAKCCELKSACREALISILGNGISLTVSGTGSMESAMAMKGGVSLREVNPKTMESRIVPGVYFAGEILDLSGPCGGFHIQWAFSSGFLAGKSAALTD